MILSLLVICEPELLLLVLLLPDAALLPLLVVLEPFPGVVLDPELFELLLLDITLLDEVLV